MALSFRTKNGDICLNWKSHADNTAEWVDIRLVYDHNHCRNPTRIPLNVPQKDMVWCYTGLGNLWEYCDVPWCLEPGQESMNTTTVEKEGIPVIITATIILGTVSFFLVIVTLLIVGNWFCSRGEEKDDRTLELVPTSDSGIYSSS